MINQPVKRYELQFDVTVVAEGEPYNKARSLYKGEQVVMAGNYDILARELEAMIHNR